MLAVHHHPKKKHGPACTPQAPLRNFHHLATLSEVKIFSSKLLWICLFGASFWKSDIPLEKAILKMIFLFLKVGKGQTFPLESILPRKNLFQSPCCLFQSLQRCRQDQGPLPPGYRVGQTAGLLLHQVPAHGLPAICCLCPQSRTPSMLGYPYIARHLECRGHSYRPLCQSCNAPTTHQLQTDQSSASLTSRYFPFVAVRHLQAASWGLAGFPKLTTRLAGRFLRHILASLSWELGTRKVPVATWKIIIPGLGRVSGDRITPIY